MGRDKGKSQSPAAELRRLAEESLVAKASGQQQTRPDEDMLKLVHELEVHQIELEMQNAALSQSRDELESALAKYTDLYDFAPISYFTLDRDGAVLAANLTAAGLLGIERSGLTGQRFGLFVAAEDRQNFSEFLAKVFLCQFRQSCELKITAGGNSPLFVHIDAVALVSEQECRVAIIDISARKLLEENLENMHVELAARAAELEDANSELEAFNYTVSHDLRLPLTVIHNYCQVLSEICRYQLDEQARKYIEEIYQGTQRMSRLISALLIFSKVKHREIRQETVDLSALALAVDAELKAAEPLRLITFRITAGITVIGDAGLWRIVLNNLIGNAWKHTVNQAQTVIEFGKTELEGKTVCFVRDNGPGFDMADAGKLFKPFQRIPGTTVDGHGIGLATVERIVRRHGGRIWAESEPGKGATIFFTKQ